MAYLKRHSIFRYLRSYFHTSNRKRHPSEKSTPTAQQDMPSFELSQYVEAGKKQAERLVKRLEVLQKAVETAKTDTALVQDVRVCLLEAQTLTGESFLFIEKETKNTRKTVDYLTEQTIKDVVNDVAVQVRLHAPQVQLAAFILHLFFEGQKAAINRKMLEARLLEAVKTGNLGDYAWSSEFEDVLENFKKKVEKLTIRFMVEDARKLLESQVKICFGRWEEG
ncbi:hypothetical protein D6C89_02514 [Aureobasidium pullulans]|uniref:Uncharacterized protein n=1 Tax=Aureobasidium pullulans TaxID=5580 RepID=A0A4S9EV27_AURPU|nr:hypothetical protein D6D10_04945 [Aureobasidium pullulans]THZ28614.1 hypothetical protein D6C89_02514 [Aureobasidium pullulans]